MTDITPSALDLRCDRYIHDAAALNPLLATDWGIGEARGDLPDYSPDGLSEAADLDRDLLAFVRDPKNRRAFGSADLITAAALEDRLSLALELDEAGENLRALNNIASPLQEIRDSFDLMAKETASDWDLIAERLAAVPGALEGFKQSLRQAASTGAIAASRQVQLAAEQAKRLSQLNAGGSFFGLLMEEGTALSDSSLPRGAAVAARAYGELSTWLERELLPIAPSEDACGRERYERFSALFVGARVDLDEIYEWGLTELADIDRQQRELASELFGPGITVAEALSRLDADPALQLRGVDALREWMQSTADDAIVSLRGTEFDIPESISTIQCMIAPSGDGGIYYTGPSADFSRPGRMWWSVPAGEDTFHTWQERTTVYHEGVPGHHLQIGQAIAESDSLNLWRRFACWNSGHGEGWALYAEQLMVELGYQVELPDLMGVLDSQRLRAARVALDIGLHLQKVRPDGVGTWDANYAWQFLKDNVAMADGFLRFELDRYLGWPGQAPSYKIGQRLWQELRTDYLNAMPTGLSPEAGRRQFHTQALRLGSLPIDTLRQALLG